MAKIGKKQPEYDPFSAEKKSFDALGDALSGLDAKPPRKKPSSKPKVPAAHREEERLQPSQGEKQKGIAAGELESQAKPKAASQTLDRTKRLKTTAEEALRWERSAMRLGAALGARVDFSKLTRALWEVYLRHEEDILKNVPEDGNWQRPSNSDAVGLAELDEQLADLLNEGLMIASRRPKNTRRSEN